jgi:hypothetical protein
VDPTKPADCKAEREQIARMTQERELLKFDRDELRRELEESEAERYASLTPDQVLKLVNDATGQMAGYWRYLGVQGAVDRAVKAELAKRT